MRRLIAIATLLNFSAGGHVALSGCVAESETGDPIAQRTDETEVALRTTIDSLEGVIAELRDTPEARLLEAREFDGRGNSGAAETAYRELAAKYPGSEEGAEAAARLEEIEDVRAREQEEAERRERLGYRALETVAQASTSEVDVSRQRVRLTGAFQFDRHGDRWYERKAARGRRYLVADVAVSAKADDIHNPKLPPIEVYHAEGTTIRHVGRMTYEFYRWQDYGSYLGNHHDTGNDFRQSRTIRFAAGLEIDDDVADDALFVFVGKEGCFDRQDSQYGNPEIRYRPDRCSAPTTLTVDQAASDYALFSLLNPGQL